MSKKPALDVLGITMWLAVAWAVSHVSTTWIDAHLESIAEGEIVKAIYLVALVLLMSYVSFYSAHKRSVPSFVTALLMGIVAKPLLEPIITNTELLTIIVSLAATFILFGGGLETPLRNFWRLFPKIAMLAFPGVLLTAFGLSFAIHVLGTVAGTTVTIVTAVLLGAILASTDPAAIMPLLKPLKFRNSDTPELAVSESALNDPVGALLTLILVGLAAAGFASIGSAYQQLFSVESGIVLVKQIVFGVAAGVLGWLLLKWLSHHKHGHEHVAGSDFMFLISIPLFTYAAALIYGGSGFLAAFIAGLLFHISENRHVEEMKEDFDHTVIDGLAKPTIFLLLGALVDLQALRQYAVVGILAAVVFIFVLRPLMVALTLGGFTLFGQRRMSVKQLIFMAWVRETGAIPAVLLVSVSSLHLPGTVAVVPIGMWVILITLILQPPLTPMLAKKLELVELEPAEITIPDGAVPVRQTFQQ